MRKIYFLSFFLLTIVIFTDSCTDKSKTAASKDKVVETKVDSESKKPQQGKLKDYVIDTENSIVEWIGTKTTGSHDGTIQIEKGVILKNKNGDIVSGKFMMNMNSIECTDLSGKKKESIEGHLKDEDFFNTIEHPSASFSILEVGPKEISGTLTIKGISHPISFEYNKLNDYQYEAEIVVDRTLFDIKYKSKTIFPELGDNFIHDDFIIKLNPLSISK